MKRIPLKQFIRTYTAVDGSKVPIIHIGSAQCPRCFSTLGLAHLPTDPAYPDTVTIEWPCPRCDSLDKREKKV